MSKHHGLHIDRNHVYPCFHLLFITKSQGKDILKTGRVKVQVRMSQLQHLCVQRTFPSAKDAEAFVSLLFLEHPQRILTRQGKKRQYRSKYKAVLL